MNIDKLAEKLRARAKVLLTFQHVGKPTVSALVMGDVFNAIADDIEATMTPETQGQAICPLTPIGPIDLVGKDLLVRTGGYYAVLRWVEHNSFWVQHTILQDGQPGKTAATTIIKVFDIEEWIRLGHSFYEFEGGLPE